MVQTPERPLKTFFKMTYFDTDLSKCFGNKRNFAQIVITQPLHGNLMLCERNAIKDVHNQAKHEISLVLYPVITSNAIYFTGV